MEPSSYGVIPWSAWMQRGGSKSCLNLVYQNLLSPQGRHYPLREWMEGGMGVGLERKNGRDRKVGLVCKMKTKFKEKQRQGRLIISKSKTTNESTSEKHEKGVWKMKEVVSMMRWGGQLEKLRNINPTLPQNKHSSLREVVGEYLEIPVVLSFWVNSQEL